MTGGGIPYEYTVSEIKEEEWEQILDLFPPGTGNKYRAMLGALRERGNARTFLYELVGAAGCGTILHGEEEIHQINETLKASQLPFVIRPEKPYLDRANWSRCQYQLYIILQKGMERI